ncbi:MAG: CDP-glucose 4,6-dehydratase [Salibacter sp.]|uniref:CDP-glucose 4,6-dehydratase n=1 Tax=Salibacter sp. TaxID=2010995 RepID=UPI0028707F08|nr:CDP-glucose 4,6-dehydratase [Salibacter sp.]MDR9399201.1 CDP-glucose 4,6-dehydratase [Salibacter sp.]
MGNKPKMEKLGLKEKLKQTYNGKKVFVTGHTGFKGTWLLLILKELGATVKGYSLKPEDSKDFFEGVNGQSHCQHVIADIRDRERLKKEVLDFQPDFIFHMAAQALVLESYQNPAETYDTNLMGTVNLLDALRFMDKPCKAIMITTDKVYENLERPEPYSETERLGGYDPYSNSKACCELAISSYRNSFFNITDYPKHYKSIAAVRSGNVIGGGDFSENRIIPDLVKSMRKGESLIVRNPSAIRPWQHVLDPLSGYLQLGMKMNEDPVDFADAFNFGPHTDDVLTVEELVKTALDSWGEGSYEVAKNIDQPHEANLLKLDIAKAKAKLGWTPFFSAKNAIQTTIEWYRKSEDTDMTDLTLAQINLFFDAQ